jgi:hypothetical protein
MGDGDDVKVPGLGLRVVTASVPKGTVIVATDAQREAVQGYAEALARAMGVPAAQVEEQVWAMLLEHGFVRGITGLGGPLH